MNTLGIKQENKNTAALPQQHEITAPHRLLDAAGQLIEPGYAKSLIAEYERSDIKASKLRIKEWDYYLIACDDFALALTIADNSYMGLDSISLLDFRIPWEHTNSPMQLLTLGKKKLPPTSKLGDVSSSGKGYELSFENDGKSRTLSFRMEKFADGKPISGTVTLETPDDETMVIATPFAEKDTAFYYNQKSIVCRLAEKCFSVIPSTNFLRAALSAHLTGDAVCGLIRILGIGAVLRVWLTAFVSVGISATASVTHRLQAKTCCFMTVRHISSAR